MMERFAPPYLPDEEPEDQIEQCKREIFEKEIGAGMEEISRKRFQWIQQKRRDPRIDPESGQLKYASCEEAEDRLKDDLDVQMARWHRQLGEKAAKATKRGTLKAWSRVRKLVWERDQGICQVCGQEIEWERYECGHIIDRTCGGTDRPSNVVVMCGMCNAIKPVTHTREEYLEWARTGGIAEALSYIGLKTSQTDERPYCAGAT